MLCRPSFEVLHNDYNRIVDHIMIYNNLKKKAEVRLKIGKAGKMGALVVGRQPKHRDRSIMFPLSALLFYFLHGKYLS